MLLLALMATTACGEAEERDLCTQYGDLQATVEQVTALDPGTATVGDIRVIADDALASLDALGATADGLYDVALSNLRAELMDFREASTQFEDEAIEAARPLIQESWDDTVTAYRLLELRLDVVCAPVSDG